MTILTDITIATGTSIIAVAELAVGDPVYIALITLISAIVTPIVSAIVVLLMNRAAIKKVEVKVDEVGSQATRIDQKADGINAAVNKELAVEREHNRGLRELLASNVEAKKQADAVSLAIATTAAPPAALASAPGPVAVEIVNPTPVPVAVVEHAADKTKDQQ